MKWLGLWLGLWVGAALGAPRLVVLDVGEGQTVLLQSGDRGLLIDAGHPGMAARLLARLQAHGVTTLEALVLTHLHPDHAGGYFRLREAFPRMAVHWNGHPLPEKVQPDLVRWIRDALRRDPLAATIKGGHAWQWRQWRLKVLWPYGFTSNDMNHHSLVLQVEAEGNTWLIMGDAGLAAERALLAQGRLPRNVDGLVVGHHGAKDASGEAFLRHVDPRLAVISVDANNIRGYPDVKVLERLEALGIEMRRTDRHGDVVLSPSASPKEKSAGR